MNTTEQALLETAPALVTQSPPVQPKPQKLAIAKLEMNRQERVISAGYLVMIAMIMVSLAVGGLVAFVGA